MATRKPSRRRPKPAVRAPKLSGASIAGNSIEQRVHAYFYSHAHGLFSSLGRLARAPITSAMTIAVLAIAVSLAGGFYILVANAQQLTGNLESSNQISLFLKQEIGDAEGRQLAGKLAGSDEVAAIEVVTKQQGMDDFRVYSGFGDALNALDENPLPVVLLVQPKNTLDDPDVIEPLVKRFSGVPEVDFVQMDMQWVKRLQSMMELAECGAMVLSLLLSMAVLFITGNTIRLELHNRREEIIIAKLIGATDAFIQRPFLYAGFWYGLLAGILAWIIDTTMMLVLRQPVEKLSALYDSQFRALFFGYAESFSLLAIAASLSMAGSWIVLVYQLRKLNPE
ncbi:MAG: permease-like cell division protein FtsX [Gammaproteobacteria bacterium]